MIIKNIYNKIIKKIKFYFWLKKNKKKLSNRKFIY